MPGAPIMLFDPQAAGAAAAQGAAAGGEARPVRETTLTMNREPAPARDE